MTLGTEYLKVFLDLISDTNYKYLKNIKDFKNYKRVADVGIIFIM